MSGLRFLFDVHLIRVGRAIREIYPAEIFICGDPGCPTTDDDDPDIYPWCREQNAILVTFDWNMLRDERVLHSLISHFGIRVLWIDQVERESFRNAFTRIVKRWPKLRDEIMHNEATRGFVLYGNNHLKKCRTIQDAVYEVKVRKRGIGR